MTAFVYILTNKYNTTLYIGVTSNLVKRLYEHQHNLVEGFSKRYNLHKLVYFEEFEDIYNAISREKYLKGKKRSFKNDLIKSFNPQLEDLGIKYNIVCHCDSSAEPQNDKNGSHVERSETSQGLVDNNIQCTGDSSPQNCRLVQNDGGNYAK